LIIIVIPLSFARVGTALVTGTRVGRRNIIEQISWKRKKCVFCYYVHIEMIHEREIDSEKNGKRIHGTMMQKLLIMMKHLVPSHLFF